MFALSGLWPHLKLLLTLYVWVSPTEERFRNSVLHFSSLWSIWSFIDVAMVIMISLAFNAAINVSVANVVDASFAVRVWPCWGAYEFCFAVIVTSFVGHFAHDECAKLTKARNPEPGARECEHRQTRWSAQNAHGAGTKTLVIALLAATTVSTCVGCVAPFYAASYRVPVFGEGGAGEKDVVAGWRVLVKDALRKSSGGGGGGAESGAESGAANALAVEVDPRAGLVAAAAADDGPGPGGGDAAKNANATEDAPPPSPEKPSAATNANATEDAPPPSPEKPSAAAKAAATDANATNATNATDANATEASNATDANATEATNATDVNDPSNWAAAAKARAAAKAAAAAKVEAAAKALADANAAANALADANATDAPPASPAANDTAAAPPGAAAANETAAPAAEASASASAAAAPKEDAKDDGENTEKKEDDDDGGKEEGGDPASAPADANAAEDVNDPANWAAAAAENEAAKAKEAAAHADDSAADYAASMIMERRRRRRRRRSLLVADEPGDAPAEEVDVGADASKEEKKKKKKKDDHDFFGGLVKGIVSSVDPAAAVAGPGGPSDGVIDAVLHAMQASNTLPPAPTIKSKSWSLLDVVSETAALTPPVGVENEDGGFDWRGQAFLAVAFTFFVLLAPLYRAYGHWHAYTNEWYGVAEHDEYVSWMSTVGRFNAVGVALVAVEILAARMVAFSTAFAKKNGGCVADECFQVDLGASSGAMAALIGVVLASALAVYMDRLLTAARKNVLRDTTGSVREDYGRRSEGQYGSLIL